MHEELETDYLVVGAGAAGMAFTDALLAHQVLANCPVALKLHIARDGEKALQMTADPTTRRRTQIRAILREQVPALT